MSPKKKRGPWRPPGKLARAGSKLLPKGSRPYRWALGKYEARRKRAVERRKST